MNTKRKQQKQPVNTQPAPKMREIVVDENHKTFYVNSVQIQQSLYDFKLIFGLFDTLPNGKTQITNLETILISPQHAKELANVLTENVRLYEENFMPLPMPISTLETKPEILIETFPETD